MEDVSLSAEYSQSVHDVWKKTDWKRGRLFYTETMTSYERWNQVQNQMLRQFPLLRLRAGRNGKFYEKKNTDYVLPRDFSEYTLEEALPVMEGWMRREEDWEDAPLFEWRYVRLKKGICMYGSFHHLILDGMSIKLFLQKQERVVSGGRKGKKKRSFGASGTGGKDLGTERLEESQNLVQASCSGRKPMEDSRLPTGQTAGQVK